MAKQSSRMSIIAGNWKMYKTIEDSLRFIDEFLPLVKSKEVKIFLAVPFTSIQPMAEKVKGTPVVIGAQNMNDASEGAFTGEVAGIMLKEAGAQFVILGHSERRQFFHESNAFINRKIKRAIADDLQPILCIGETMEEREANKTQEVLNLQLKECLADLGKREVQKLAIAYEPVWAIGTGITPTPEEAQQVHAALRLYINEQWGDVSSSKMVIMYGGSVKPDNVNAYMEQADIDGVLVGGAALQPATFAQIVNYSIDNATTTINDGTIGAVDNQNATS